MVRMQVQLTEEQARVLRELSAATGASIAELVRHGVDLRLAGRRHGDRQRKVTRALAAVGKFSSGLSDVSVKHDEYLAESFGEWKSS